MSLKSMDITHSPLCKEFLMLSGVSISQISDFRYLFSELGSRIGIHLLLGFWNQEKSIEES